MSPLNFGPMAGRLTGRMADRQVWIDEDRIDPTYSLEYVRHSPDGFNWGYSGSGPAQLAFAVLLAMFGAEIAMAHYQEFKRVFIANLPPTNFAIDISEVNEWMRVQSQKKGETEDVH